MNARKITGWILVGLVGGIMLLAGSAKMFGLMPAEEVEKMGPIGQQLRLIGAGCFLSGLLLLVPRTSSIGLLLASSYWGGAICTHLIQETSIVAPAILLVLTWGGTALRDRRAMWSFESAPAIAASTSHTSATPVA